MQGGGREHIERHFSLMIFNVVLKRFALIYQKHAVSFCTVGHWGFTSSQGWYRIYSLTDQLHHRSTPVSKWWNLQAFLGASQKLKNSAITSTCCSDSFTVMAACLPNIGRTTHTVRCRVESVQWLPVFVLQIKSPTVVSTFSGRRTSLWTSSSQSCLQSP